MDARFWHRPKKAKFKNACDLLNRYELSRTQNRELQRFIDANKHILELASEAASKLHNDRNNLQRPSNTTPKERNGRSAKRKEVKWVDEDHRGNNQRARSLTPTPQRNLTKGMSHYGSLGSLYTRGADPYYARDSTYSPAYSFMDRSQDDLIRYETGSQGSRRERRRNDSESRTKFAGYGDRVGSGVEFTPADWRGGEIIYDPLHLPKSLKPRRLYYSPIGDGVVAADGVELKPKPKDMSPRITVSHVRAVERGAPGRAGYNLYEKHVTQGGSEAAPTYGLSGAHSPRSPSNLSTGNDLLDRLSRQGLGTPDSARGRTSANLNWPESDSSRRSPNAPWSGGKGPYDRQDFGRGNQGYDPNNLLDSPRGKFDRYNSAPPSGYNTYDSHQPSDRYGTMGGPADRFGTHGGPTDRYGAQGTPVDRYGTQGGPGDRYGAQGGPGDRYGSQGGTGDRYGTQGGTGDRYGTYGGPADRYGGHGDPADRYGTRSQASDRYGSQSDRLNTYGSDQPSEMRGLYSRQRNYSESSGKFDVTKDYLITNPRELIHQYATTTPISILDGNTDNQTNLRNVKKSYAYETEERYAPYPPYKGTTTTVHPNNFVKQLRDENLTLSQKEANRFRDPVNAKDEQSNRKITEICEKTKRTVSPQEIDFITEKLLCDLRTGHPTPSRLY